MIVSGQMKIRLVFVLVVVMFVALYPAMANAQQSVETGSLNVARRGHQATLLPDGRVLVSGGYDASSGGIAAAEIYNPATGVWSVVGSNIIARLEHAASLLQDGRVLVVGGISNYSSCSSNNTAETFEPSTNAWSLTNLPIVVGSGAAAVKLLDGRVLVSGGGDRCGTAFSTAAIFDPVSNTWTATSAMHVAREFHSAILLGDGRVLVAGGVGSSPFNHLASAEIFDPSTSTWTTVGNMSSGHAGSCDGFTLSFWRRREPRSWSQAVSPGVVRRQAPLR
jgi:hypothetical protein